MVASIAGCICVVHYFMVGFIYFRFFWILFMVDFICGRLYLWYVLYWVLSVVMSIYARL